MSAPKLSDKKLVRMFAESMRMARTAMSAEPASFPDRGETVTLAAAFIAGGFVSADGKAARPAVHAGADDDQNAKLNTGYGDDQD